MRYVTTSNSLFNFDESNAIGAWFVVNDGVMGGVSQSKILMTAGGTMRFTGVVSLENNGGFASIQTQFAPLNLSAYEGIELRVRGDGKQYGFNLRDNFGAIVHQAEFQTEAESWQTLQIPFKTLQPNWFGYPAQRAPRLDTSRVVSMSIIIEQQIGQFVLEVASIGVY